MISSFANKFVALFGYEIKKYDKFGKPEFDMEKEFVELYDRCKGCTMTTVYRMYALYKAVEYITKKEMEGDIVECGVWKGGSSMLVAETLAAAGDINRKLYLFDTYSGMSEPTKKDRKTSNGELAIEKWKLMQKREYNKWAYAPLQEVKDNLMTTGYPKERLFFIEGRVEDTIPKECPDKIALLRLDTDWYESTMHELVYLFPKLVSGGVIIIDDYGNWQGAREAVDEYWQKMDVDILLNRIDTAGRIGVKK